MSEANAMGMDVIRGAPPASFTAINTTVTATQLWTPALWTPVPAGDARPGKIYKVSFGGILSTTATPTVVFTPVWGVSATLGSNISFGASPTVTCGTIAASQPFYGEFTVAFRQIGVAAAGATATGNGVVTLSAAAAATVTPHVTIGGAVPTTIDQTIAGGISVFLTWGTSNASNTCTCQWVALQTLN